MAGRYWGIWTRGKLDILERYLDRFTTVTKSRSTERVYLDLFAGQPQNLDRLTNEELRGSARIALDTSDPPFTRLAFFELGARAVALKAELTHRYPERRFVVYDDANARIQEALADLADVAWAPTFAFVDPDGPDCHWATLEALTRHKQRSRTKVEMWLLFPAGLFMRQLPVYSRNKLHPRDSEQITKMYGTVDWEAIYQRRVADFFTAAEAREEYVNLMRWRLERDLQYRFTHPLEIHNERGVSIYHMIFATDSEAGDRIMRSLYEHALNEFPAMREHARRTRRRLAMEAEGQFDLFSMAGDDGEPWLVEPGARSVVNRGLVYKHEPPWRPPAMV